MNSATAALQQTNDSKRLKDLRQKFVNNCY